MAPRPERRDKWRQTKNGSWTCSFGHRGHRVRLFQNCKDGVFYRAVQLPGGVRTRRSLGTRDRKEAERLGKALLATLLLGKVPEAPRIVRLGELADAFVAESPMFLDNAAHTKADQRTRIAILRTVIGDARDVSTLTEHDVRQYEARRKSGGISYGDGKVTDPVRQRSVQADVKLLKQMLRWACTRTTSDGRRWLNEHPLEYVSVKGEADVRRAVASQERFEATRSAIRRLQQHYLDEAQAATRKTGWSRAMARHLTWVRAELGLVLLEATGRRRGAIMGLQWSDVDFSARKITWRAEHDKKNRTWLIPYPEALFDELRGFQDRLGVSIGPLFPRRDAPSQALPPELLSQWISKAESKAELPKLEGSLCHAYRRKWRSERSDLPMKAVAVAGGWSDIDTMLRCYDVPDDAEVLRVTSADRKRREAISA